MPYFNMHSSLFSYALVHLADQAHLDGLVVHEYTFTIKKQHHTNKYNKCLYSKTSDLYTVRIEKYLTNQNEIDVNPTNDHVFFFFIIRAQSICPRCTTTYKAYCAILIPPCDSNVPTSTATRLHVHMTREILAAKGGTCGQECWTVILPKCRLPCYI
jgi:hypothetical protein